MITYWLACVATIKLSTHVAVNPPALVPPPALFSPDSMNLASFSLSLPLPGLCVELLEAALIHSWPPGKETRLLFVLLKDVNLTREVEIEH